MDEYDDNFDIVEYMN